MPIFQAGAAPKQEVKRRSKKTAPIKPADRFVVTGAAYDQTLLHTDKDGKNHHIKGEVTAKDLMSIGYDVQFGLDQGQIVRYNDYEAKPPEIVDTIVNLPSV